MRQPPLLFALSLAAAVPVHAQVTIAVDNAAPALNSQLGDVIGIGIQSVVDRDGPALTQALREIDVRHVRYQSGFEDSWLFDPADPDQGIVGMKDPGFWWTGFAAYGGEWNQSVTLSEFGDLLIETGADGHAVLSIDPVNYRGTADAALAAMSYRERVDMVKQAAVDYVTYNRDNDLGITHFEIGNEPDYELRDPLDPQWSTAVYAAVVEEIAQAIRAVDPSIKIGAHGGLQANSPEDRASDRYLDTLLSVVKDDIDFVVSHNYAFWVRSYDFYANGCSFCSFETTTNNINRGIDLYAPDEGLEISVTEWSGFQQRQPARFWHGLLTLDMIGDVVAFDRVEEMLLWTAVWLGDDKSQVFTDASTYARSPIGDAVKLFVDNTQPEIVANGESGLVEYFHTRNPATGAMTTFLINRGDVAQAVTLQIAGADPDASRHATRLLLNDASDPEALTSTLVDGPEATWSDDGSGLRTVTLTVPPVSGAAVAFAPAAPLPVELVTFGAERAGADVALSWETAAESDVAFFEPAYSFDATAWTPLGRQAAAGRAARYTATHAKADARQLYYRLRIVDEDGGEAFSKVVAVGAASAVGGSRLPEVTLAPNPVSATARVSGTSAVGLEYAEATDVLGRAYRLQLAGDVIDLAGLPAGVYALRFYGANAAPLARGRVVKR